MRATLNFGLLGIQRANQQLEAAASNISRLSVPNAKSVRATDDRIVATDAPVDVVENMVNLSVASSNMKANANVVRTASDMTGWLIDMWA